MVVSLLTGWYHALLWHVHTHKGSAEDEKAFRAEAPHFPTIGSGMWCPYSQEPALRRASGPVFQWEGRDGYSFFYISFSTNEK